MDNFLTLNNQRGIYLDVDKLVEDAVEGLLQLDDFITVVDNVKNVVVRKDIMQIKKDSVTLISGGGSGHEPAHAGFIGHGMLSAAVLGNVFASPSVSQVRIMCFICTCTSELLSCLRQLTDLSTNPSRRSWPRSASAAATRVFCWL